LKSIEESLGRPSSKERNAPRPIDLDILFFGRRQIVQSTLIIPHPQLQERDFVIGPLIEYFFRFLTFAWEE
jgi:2-amino-4-hydroxy-6-hydroxymethyldihydropteridine diphosphokinase